MCQECASVFVRIIPAISLGVFPVFWFTKGFIKGAIKARKNDKPIQQTHYALDTMCATIKNCSMTDAPNDIGNDKYRLMCNMCNSQRQTFSLIVSNSANGEWTTYEDCENAGIKNASKRLSEIIEDHSVPIIKRKVGRVLHFCV